MNNKFILDKIVKNFKLILRENKYNIMDKKFIQFIITPLDSLNNFKGFICFNFFYKNVLNKSFLICEK